MAIVGQPRRVCLFRKLPIAKSLGMLIQGLKGSVASSDREEASILLQTQGVTER